MRTLLLALTAVLLPLGADALLPGTAAAQTPAIAETPTSATDDETFRRFSVGMAADRALAGSPDAIHDLFMEHGFDDTETFGCFIFCIGPQERPRVDGAARELMVSARYRLDRRWSAAAFVTASTETAMTEGFRRPGYGLDLSHGLSTWALAAGYRILPGVDLSVGPALYRVTLRRVFERVESWTSTELGLLVDGGVELPADRRFYVRLFGQYRWVPATRFGPLRVDSGPFDDAPSITFEAFDLDSSQLVFGLGVGVRF